MTEKLDTNSNMSHTEIQPERVPQHMNHTKADANPVYSLAESPNNSLENLESGESEFDINDALLSDDDIFGAGGDSDFGDEYEDEDDDDESFLILPVTNSTKKELSEGNVPNLKYECLTTQGMLNNMVKKVHHLQPILNMSPEDIFILMHHCDWNEERLLEAWTERMDELLVECGISQRITDETQPSDDDNNNNNDGDDNGPQKVADGSKKTKRVRGLRFRNNFMCDICCDEKSTETFALDCGHEYCVECYRRYIEDRLYSGDVITCMSCSLVLRNDDIDKIMGHASSRKLMDSAIKSFVAKHYKTYKWCRYTDCKCIIHLLDTTSLSEYTRLHYSPFVKCNLGHRFCFNCGYEIHAPADCNIATAWVKKAREESVQLNWILSNTKECPKCTVNIEKNGGCNHMTCTECGYEFCWICEGEWKLHGTSYYHCTLYKNDANHKNSRNELKTKSMKRYTFYYRMYNEHEMSSKLDRRLGQTVESKVRALQEKMGVSWIEGQFLTEGIRTLAEGRAALKWSFAVAYYSDASHNLTKIFLDNQGLLSNAVEDLSELLQINDPEVIMKRKPEFYNKARYVENRTYALMECGRDLLCKGISKPVDY